MITEPPVLEGAVQETTTCVLPNTPETPVGEPGTIAGTTAPDTLDDAPVPTTFVAVTVNMYDVPLVRPVTVHEIVAVVHVNEPGEDVTV